MKKPARRPMVEVRHSRVHGHGVFALRRIRKGTTIMEYLGDRVSHEEADARYEDKAPNDNHTFLFTVDSKTVIDGGVGGNDARYINHGCDPNCESASQGKRIFVEAVRTIQPGEELAYDYQIQRDPEDPPNVDEIFACRCGADKCRGSMLVAPRKPRKKKPTARAATRFARKPVNKPAKRPVDKKSANKKSVSKKSVNKKSVNKKSGAVGRSVGSRSAGARKAESRPTRAGTIARRNRDVKRRSARQSASRRRGR
jgi:uncharacterized protein